jgi:hypothetical protein
MRRRAPFGTSNSGSDRRTRPRRPRTESHGRGSYLWSS